MLYYRLGAAVTEHQLRPAQRRILFAVMDGPVKTKPTQRPAVQALVRKGLVEVHEDGVRLTTAGRTRCNEEFRPRVHLELSDNWVSGREKRWGDVKRLGGSNE